MATPLKGWDQFSPALSAALALIGVRTVEDLAGLPADQASRLGRNAGWLVGFAQRWLQQSQSLRPIHPEPGLRLVVEIEAMRELICEAKERHPRTAPLDGALAALAWVVGDRDNINGVTS
ncbi:hypothetical protein [Magnetococcus sp. PR-3]|uniref:hypothetical protein n=1 Tax=Magnetococcus sp. PR-3 TaxID=3120355 RepID=UPI002FCE1942